MNLEEISKNILQPVFLMNMAAGLLSLICSYVPKWREKWAAKDPVFKSLGMLGAVTFITVIVGVLSFTHLVQVVPATGDGIVLLLVAWISTLWTNEMVYKKSPEVPSVTVIKAQRNLLLTAKASVKNDKAQAVAEAEKVLRDVQASAPNTK